MRNNYYRSNRVKGLQKRRLFHLSNACSSTSHLKRKLFLRYTMTKSKQDEEGESFSMKSILGDRYSCLCCDSKYCGQVHVNECIASIKRYVGHQRNM